MKATGLDHLTRELGGLHRIMTANASLWVTGEEMAVEWNIITIAPANTTVTSVTTIRTTTSEAMTATGTTSSRRPTFGRLSVRGGIWDRFVKLFDRTECVRCRETLW